MRTLKRISKDISRAKNASRKGVRFFNQAGVSGPKTRLENLHRLAEFGRLSSGIFHDLLNPLTAVLLAIEELKQERKADVGSFEKIESAVRASKRIEDFIKIAKKQLDPMGRKEMFALENEIEDAIRILGHKLRTRKVETRLHSTERTYIFGNPIRFFQIALNLISNAIDSYPENGKGCYERTVDINVTVGRDRLKVEVLDRGCGIPPAALSSIFDPFFTTKKKDAGLGLGLSSAKEIIESEFNGTIAVESVPDKGSRFVIDLPRQEKEAGIGTRLSYPGAEAAMA